MRSPLARAVRHTTLGQVNGLRRRPEASTVHGERLYLHSMIFNSIISSHYNHHKCLQH